MGLIKAGPTTVYGVTKDTSLQTIYCENMGNDVLISSGISKQGNNNLITNESRILVGENQILIVVSGDSIVDSMATVGEYNYEKDSIENSDYKAYFINSGYIKGNKFGTTTPIPFKDSNLGITVDTRCYGEYILQITDPIAFYNTYGKNIEDKFIVGSIRDELLVDFMQALEPAFARISLQKISYDMLPGETNEISKVVRECLQYIWKDKGISVVSVSIASVTPTDSSALAIKTAKENNVSITDSINVVIDNKDIELNDNIQDKVEENIFADDELKEPIVDDLFGNDEQIEENIPSEVICPNCGALITGNFCTECGTKKL